MYLGCDYYPEHWPEDRWEKDAQMMSKAGFNVVENLILIGWIRPSKSWLKIR